MKAVDRRTYTGNNSTVVSLLPVHHNVVRGRTLLLKVRGQTSATDLTVWTLAGHLNSFKYASLILKVK